MKSVITGSGIGIPKNVVRNDALTKIMDTSDEWIRTRSGVEERRYVDDGQGSAELGMIAAQSSPKVATPAARQPEAEEEAAGEGVAEAADELVAGVADAGENAAGRAVAAVGAGPGGRRATRSSRSRPNSRSKST